MVSKKRNRIVKIIRFLSSSLRFLPNFLIIGAQRSGTTSLYNYLAQHPRIRAAHKKEVHFFDKNFNKGLNWYRAHFPVKTLNTSIVLTGEASPYYLFNPQAPKRVFTILPNIKLIILLRNPIDRAYSHYQHEYKLGHEQLSFTEALAREDRRLLGEGEKMLNDANYNSYNYEHYSYLGRGRYIEQLKIWYDLFDPNQIFVIKSEDFFTDPEQTVSKAFTFLKLPSTKINVIDKYNENIYKPMDLEIRAKLNNYFSPYNKQLSKYLGANFNWEN